MIHGAFTLQQGNVRRQGDTLIVGCVYPDCPWSEPFGAGFPEWDSKGKALDEAAEKLHAHLEALHPAPAGPLLTDEELEAIDLMGRVADLLGQIVAPGPTAEQDILELHHHVHAIQRTIGSQAAARAYPNRFRLLGSTLVPGL